MDDHLTRRLEDVQIKLREIIQPTNTVSASQAVTDALAEVVEATRATTHLQEQLTDLQNKYQILLQQATQQQIFNSIIWHICQSFITEDILKHTITGVQQLLQVDRAIVYCCKDTQQSSVMVEGSKVEYDSHPSIDGYQIWANHSLGQHAEPILIEDTHLVPALPSLVPLLKPLPVRALLMVPMIHKGQLGGFICAQQAYAPRSWQPLELELLTHLAEQTAIALQQAELYHHVQQLNTDLEQKIQQRTAQVQKVLDFESMLKRITDKVRDSLDENQILQTVVKELTIVLGLGGCNSALYDLEKGTSTIRYEYTNSLPAYQGRVAQMDHFPELYRQLQDGYSFQFCSLVPNPIRGLVAMLACPIFVDPDSSQGMNQAVLGDLWLIHHKEYVFSEFEIRLVQQVANQCAIAIRQARLYQAAQVQVRELEKLNRLKDEFLSTVSHELRTPITNVKMAIHMLKIAPTEDRRQRWMDILEAETAREAELIDELLDLQRLEASSYPIDLAQTYIQDWLLEVIEPFRSRITNQKQILEVDCPPNLPPIVTDLGILQRILSELLNNACKYTPIGHTIALHIGAIENVVAPQTVLTIRNQAEIPSEELPHIFEKFYRVIQADRYKQGGTGLGLALVQKRVEQLGGQIEVVSSNGWTTFTIQLPTLASQK